MIRAIRKRLHPASNARIQILSDLHLEVGQQYASFNFPASAPFLLLAGDIGRLIDYEGYLYFLSAQVSRYQKVFLVLGNHEFYGLDYESGLEQAQRLAAEPNLAAGFVLLNRTRWDDPDSRLTIIGCTLWSAIPEDAYDLVRSKISDYKKIDGWTPQRHNEAHYEEVTWLREEVAKLTSDQEEVRGRQLLVATHHAPCMEGTSRPEHSANPWTPAFATDLVDEPAWNGVKIWVFGHTHFSTDFLRNGIRLVANQRGYVVPGIKAPKKESKLKGSSHDFDAEMFISIHIQQ